MGVREWRRIGAVLVVVVAAVGGFVLLTRDDDGPSAGDPAVSEAQLLVPADEVREYRLTRVGTTEPKMLDDGAGPLVIVRFEDHVVAVASASVEQARQRDGELEPDPRRATIGDRPTVGYGWQLSPLTEPSGEGIAWFGTDDTIVHASSRSLDLDGLVRLAEQVEVDGDGGLDVPGDVIGEIPAMWSAPRPGTTAVFEREDERVTRRFQLTILTADRSTQDAYLALAAPDGSIDGRTVASCCRHPIAPRRTLDVEGREAIAAPLDASRHVVVLRGDPGVVVLVPGGQYQSTPRDVWLVALAESLRPVPADDLAPFEEALRLPG